LAVFGTADNYFSFREILLVMEDVANLSWEQSQESPDFRTLNEDWSACMARRGADGYATPQEPQQKAWAGDEPSAQEITVATADVACKNEVDYVGRASAIEGAVQARLLSSRPGLVDQFVSVREAVSARLGD
jgi:hypothetical protein